jgi:hypothetical protein
MPAPSYVAPPVTYPQPVAPQVMPSGKKKSSIGRDAAIGVAIAVLVFGVILIVKFAVLDSDSAPVGNSDSGGQTSSIATIRVSLPSGVSADLFVDDKKIATVGDKQEIPATAGQRKVKLVGPSGAQCEQALDLAAGKSTSFECPSIKASSAETPGPDSVVTAPASSPVEVPDTKVPEPDTKSPDTQAPDTKVPDTTAPDTKVPDAKVPDTTDTKVPDAKVPDAKAPDTKAPDTKAPDTKAPDTKAPDTKAPDTKAPKPGTKAAKLPDTKSPTTKPPDTKALPTAKLPAENTKAEAKGYLQVHSTPIAKILVDGADTGLSTPINGKQLALTPGKHKVTFVIGTDKFTYPVIIKVGAIEVLEKDLE